MSSLAQCPSIIMSRSATRGGGNRAIAPPKNFHKRMYLYGAATGYIILPPPKISVGCGPDHVDCHIHQRNHLNIFFHSYISIENKINVTQSFTGHFWEIFSLHSFLKNFSRMKRW